LPGSPGDAGVVLTAGHAQFGARHLNSFGLSNTFRSCGWAPMTRVWRGSASAGRSLLGYRPLPGRTASGRAGSAPACARAAPRGTHRLDDVRDGEVLGVVGDVVVDLVGQAGQRTCEALPRMTCCLPRVVVRPGSCVAVRPSRGRTDSGRELVDVSRTGRRVLARPTRALPGQVLTARTAHVVGEP
jgi:hypothetical protein